MKPEYRAEMIKLALLYNQKLRVLCLKLSEGLAETDTCLVYSDAMSTANIGSPEFLSSVDAWHPSVLGHQALADSACSIIEEQAGFLGWTNPVR